MALGRALSVVLTGLDAHIVTVEADVGVGLPKTVWTGLPDTAVRESAQRVKSAIASAHEPWPAHTLTIGLLPASVRKSGSRFDVAIAIAVLAAQGGFEHNPAVCELVILGELGLDGRVHAVTGVLPSVIGAVRNGCFRVVVPRANAGEARLVPGAEVTGVGSLAELCAILRGEWVDIDPEPNVAVPVAEPVADLADVVGQGEARQALEIAAAGGHHILFTGPPGVGKTMLAERLPGLLPDLSDDQALEVTAIHSILGRLPAGRPLIIRPPFCAPHHSATPASLVGGGSGVPMPGTISLAHHGVLFMDEATEFDRRALDSLRQPLESGMVTISRAGGAATYPSQFQLVLAANPCPCAKAGRSMDASGCICTAVQRRAYQARLSGPLLDRIDLRARMAPISRAILSAGASGEPTEVVRERVMKARDRAARRLRETPWRTNAEVPGPVLRSLWQPPPDSLVTLKQDVDRHSTSTRGIDKVLKVAWTIADLGGRDQPSLADVDAARGLRSGMDAAMLARSA